MTDIVPVGRHVRTKSQREADLVFIGRLYVQGRTTAQEIHEALMKVRPYRLSVKQIFYDLTEIRDAWRESYKGDVNQKINADLKKLDVIEAEAWGQWEASGGTVESVVTAIGGQHGERTQTHKKRLEKNDKWLKLIMDCIRQRAILVGYSSPVRHEHSGPDGGPIPIRDTAPDEFMERAKGVLKAEEDRKSRRKLLNDKSRTIPIEVQVRPEGVDALSTPGEPDQIHDVLRSDLPSGGLSRLPGE